MCVYRRVLVDAGFQLSDNEEFVIYVADCNKYDDDDDVDDDSDADTICAAKNSEIRASLECYDAVDEEGWC